MFTQNNYFAKNKTNIINKNNNKTVFNDIKTIFHGILRTFRSYKRDDRGKYSMGGGVYSRSLF